MKDLAGTPLKGCSQVAPLIILSDLDFCQGQNILADIGPGEFPAPGPESALQFVE